MKRTTRLKRPQVPEMEQMILFDEIGNRPKYAGVEMTSETDIPSVENEALAREQGDSALQQEIDNLKNAPDVVDIVATYAALQAYDTSKLTDKDIIRVLADETHDGQSTYYRWTASSSTWAYIGAVGDYYTKSQTDALLADKLDGNTTFWGRTAANGAVSGTIDLGDGATIGTHEGEGSNVGLLLSRTDGTHTSAIDIRSSGIHIGTPDTSVIAFDTASGGVISAGGAKINGVGSPTSNGDAANKAYVDSGLATKQNVLTAGANVQISNENVISATDTTYSAGAGLDLTGTEFSIDNTVALKSEIPTKTSDITNDGSDGTSTYVEADDLATVATTGDYGDLLNTPTDITVKEIDYLNPEEWDDEESQPTQSTIQDILANHYTLIHVYGIPIDEGIEAEMWLIANVSADVEGATGARYYYKFDEGDEEEGTSPNIEQYLFIYDDHEGGNYQMIVDSFELGSDASWGFITGNLSDQTDLQSTLNTKQDSLVPGTNIQIASDGVTISATDTTYSAFTGADSSTAGTSGLVPAPAAGDETKFLSGNGLWTTVSQYSLPIASANDLGGVKVGTNLSIDSGTGVLSATDTTYSAFTGTDGTAAGTSGLVPAPAIADANKFLNSDGTWKEANGVEFIDASGVDFQELDPMLGPAYCLSEINTVSKTASEIISIIKSGKKAVLRLTIDEEETPPPIPFAFDGANYYIDLSYEADVDGGGGIISGSLVILGANGDLGYIPLNLLFLMDTEEETGYLFLMDMLAIDFAVLNSRINYTNSVPTTSTPASTVGSLLVGNGSSTKGKVYVCTDIIQGTDPDPDTYVWQEVGVSTINSQDWSALWQ